MDDIHVDIFSARRSARDSSKGTGNQKLPTVGENEIQEQQMPRTEIKNLKESGVLGSGLSALAGGLANLPAYLMQSQHESS